MKILGNIKLSVRILISFGSAAVLVVVLGWILTSKVRSFSISAQNQLLDITSRVTELNNLQIPVLQLQTILFQTQSVVTSRNTAKNPKTISAALVSSSSEISKSKSEIDSILNALLTNSTPETNIKIREIKTMLDSFTVSQSSLSDIPEFITRKWVEKKLAVLNQGLYQLKNIDNKIDDLTNEEQSLIAGTILINNDAGNRFKNLCGHSLLVSCYSLLLVDLPGICLLQNRLDF
jgi:hypothetical protein